MDMIKIIKGDKMKEIKNSEGIKAYGKAVEKWNKKTEAEKKEIKMVLCGRGCRATDAIFVDASYFDQIDYSNTFRDMHEKAKEAGIGILEDSEQIGL
jgi:hypothetical protein